jgi:hypothetical protein
MSLVLMALCLFFSGCGSDGTPFGAVVGRAGRYDYSPSIIRTGSQLQIWWCGDARNPQKSDQDTDAILYETVDTVSGKRSDPVVVLAETPGTWDEVFTCNPRVIRGSFVNPLGDGATYTYAMYYVATAAPAGVDNSIGAAFSKDGVHWSKYKDPVIASQIPQDYGVGQPVVYNSDGKSNLVMLYEDSTTSIEHFEATSSDGIHFTVVGKLTKNGLDANNPTPSWGDAAFDPVTRSWYAAFNLPFRYLLTTGGHQESGQYGIQLYRIPAASLLNGAQPWQLMKTFDTNATGRETNFLAGFGKDLYGNLNVGANPKIQLYPSFSNPQTSWAAVGDDFANSGSLWMWDIGSFLWDDDGATLTLTRYKNSGAYDTTTGYIDPAAGFKNDAVIGHLLSAPQGDAETPFFNCKNGAKDYFVSLAANCDGKYVVGLEGYGSAKLAGENTVAMYSCTTTKLGHFVSKDPQCEGDGKGTFLGYAQP